MKKSGLKSACILAAVAALGAAMSFSQEKKETPAPPKITHYGDLKWTPIIKGCDLAGVAGDAEVEGAPFVIRVRCVDGAKIPAHWHPTDENATVLKGTFLVGMGETFDETKLTPMNAGNFAMMPKEMRHFGMCKGETIVQIHGAGPFKVNWVNPADVIPPDKPGTVDKPKS